MKITEVLLTEVGDRRDPGPRSSRPEWLSVAAMIHAEHSGDRLAGGGASTLPSGNPSPWNAAAVGAGLDEAARRLAGTVLPDDEREPLAATRAVLGEFDELVLPRAATRSQRTAVACLRGALEAALLDLLSRARGTELPELIGARRPMPARSARGLQVSGDLDALRAKVTAQHARYPVTRLISSGRTEDDLRAVLAAERANLEAGGGKPLWLECDSRYSASAAGPLVAQLGTMLRDGRLTNAVYLEQPLPRARRDEMVALSGQVREFMAESTGSGPELHIVLDESVEAPGDIGPFARDGSLTAISVDLRRGLDTALRIVDRAVDENPEVMVIASGVGQLIDLEAAMLAAAARVLPKLDLYLPARATVKLARDPESELDAGWAASPGPGGLGAPPSLPRFIAWMGRCAWESLGPVPDPWESSAVHNEFNAYGLETLGKNSLDSYLLEREALRLGLRTVRFRSVDFHAEDRDGRSIGFHCTTGPSTSRYIGKVCGDKQVARAILSRAGVRVPAGRAFPRADSAAALEFARSLGWPVVVKPSNGKGGIGVTTNIGDDAELKRAFAGLVKAGYSQIVVENHIEGADYRFLVVGHEVVSVVKRTAGSIVGDGRSTVAELVLAKNAARLRNPHLRTRLLVLGEQALHLLQARGMNPDSVPEKGEHIRLTTAGNISRGGDSIEVLDETHSSLLEMAVRAVAAVPGLDHAGVDFLAEDHRRPLDGQSAAICELNSLPATTSHHYPALGPPRNVSRALMEFYAGRYGLVAEPRPDTVSIGMRISGKVQAVGYRQWFAQLARQLGLSGHVRNSAQGGLVEAEVTGPIELVSALSLQAIFGPGKAAPELVETFPIADVHAGRFAIARG